MPINKQAVMLLKFLKEGNPSKTPRTITINRKEIIHVNSDLREAKRYRSRILGEIKKTVNGVVDLNKSNYLKELNKNGIQINSEMSKSDQRKFIQELIDYMLTAKKENKIEISNYEIYKYNLLSENRILDKTKSEKTVLVYYSIYEKLKVISDISLPDKKRNLFLSAALKEVYKKILNSQDITKTLSEINIKINSFISNN